MTRRVPNARILAVLLRELQWLADDAAHRLPAGTFPAGELEDLAAVLDQLAHAIRLHNVVPAEGELPAGD